MRTYIKDGFAYRRPRCPLTHLWRLIKRLLRRHSRRIAQIGAQAVLSGSLIAAGILVGLNPPGAFLAFAGLILAFPMEKEESDEEYRQMVIAHFEARGKRPPRWTRREVSDE